MVYLEISSELDIIYRPGLAGAALQNALLIIKSPINNTIFGYQFTWVNLIPQCMLLLDYSPCGKCCESLMRSITNRVTIEAIMAMQGDVTINFIQVSHSFCLKGTSI